MADAPNPNTPPAPVAAPTQPVATPAAAPEAPPAPTPVPAPEAAPVLDESQIRAAMAAEQMLRRQDELGAYMKQMETELAALKAVRSPAPSPASVPTPYATADLPEDVASDPLAQKIVSIEQTVSTLAQTMAAQREEQQRARAEMVRAQERTRNERLRESERANVTRWLNEGVIKNDPELANHAGVCEELRDYANSWMSDKFDPTQDLQFQGRALQLDMARRISALKQRFGLQQPPRQQALERNAAVVNNPAPGASGVAQVPQTPGAPASPFKHPADTREGLRERFLAKAAALGIQL